LCAAIGAVSNCKRTRARRKNIGIVELWTWWMLLGYGSEKKVAERVEREMIGFG
jgi:hypothetical protein